jgi:predicted neuraminidase
MTKWVVFFIVAGAVAHGFSGAESPKPHFKGELIFEKVEGFPSCHAATIAELPNGDLFVAWYAGEQEKATDVAILYSRRAQGSEKWSEPKVLVDTPNKSEGNPILWCDPKGTLWLFYVTMQGDGWTTCNIKYIKSKDNGATWSEPVLLREELGWMTGTKPLVLKNGEILLPLYDEVNVSSVFMISGDGGKTWVKTGPIKSNPGNIQPSVVQLDDGSLLCYMRTWRPGKMWQSTSRDNGRTWSKATQHDLPNPGSRLDMVRLKSGEIVLIFNNTPRGRTPLSAALSRDEGKTWPLIKNLETAKGEYSYPAVIQTRDGLIHVVYTYRRTHIKHVEFDKDWPASAQADEGP